MADAEAALRAAREAALVVDAPSMRVLVATGPDRQKWLNGLVTCDVAKLAHGEAAYGLAVSQKGRVVTDLYVVLGESALDVALPELEAAEVLASFQRYLVMEDAELTLGPGLGVTFAYGPAAGEVLAAAQAAGARGARIDRAGVLCAVVIAPEAQRDAVRGAMSAAASARGGHACDAATWGVVRLALAVPELGVDFGGSTYPQEAGLEKSAIAFDKGCYLGQEVVCMLELRGHVKRRLVQLAVEGAEVPRAQAGVTDDAGVVVGEVTSAAATPEGVRALAMVKRALAEPGRPVRVTTAAESIRAEVRCLVGAPVTSSGRA
jgi:folate-binding protein YgfZ